MRIPDIGKRTGVISGVLGALCVLGELCFLLPGLVVSPNAMPFYRAIVNRFFGFLPIFVLGFSPSAVYAYILFVSFHAVYIHANVRHRWPYLRWIFATPEFHHWHHTSDEEGIDTNFAVFLSFIDVIFRTAHMPDYWPKGYGTTKFQPPETYLGQLTYPFQKHEETPYG